MHKKRKPDFLCISPHKTGTTWLYLNLKEHPKVWLPPKKELWILNQLDQSYLSRWKQYLNHSGMPGDNRRYFEAYLRTMFKDYSKATAKLETLWWWFKFLALPYSLRTHSILFSQNPALVTGDITPNYYFLNSETVERYALYNPDAFILLILRNPVERVWSYARMTIEEHYGKPLTNISTNEFMAYFDHLHYWWKSYPDQIELWQRNFPKLFLGYYDLLKEQPLLFFKQICRFLQIEDDFLPSSIKQVIHQGQSLTLSDELSCYLSNQYRDEISRLSNMVDSPYPQKWLKN